MAEIKVIMSIEEIENIFYSALCNALGWIQGYGLQFDYKDEEYKAAKEKLYELKPETSICYEDILMQLLRDGGSLTMIDEEGEGEMTRTITLKDVHEWVPKVKPETLITLLNEEGDVIQDDEILQTVWFHELVFS